MGDSRDAGREAALLERVRQGDAAAAEALLRPYGALMASLAGRFQAEGLQREELVQAGYMGMLLAARHYDPARTARFATYAVPWALGEMRRALRKTLDTMGAYDPRRRLLRTREALKEKLGRAPSAGELAKACGMTDLELAQTLCAAVPESLDSQAGRDAPPLEERLPCGEIDIEAVDLRLALGRLSEEERKLILLRYFSDRTQKETAALLQKSQAQISRIERRALDALRAWLTPEKA